MIVVYMWRPKDWNPALAPKAVSHIAIAFTGLGQRSFYIDWDSGKTPDFYTTDFWYATKHYGDHPIRVPILTKEDGNPEGLDEAAAFKWWLKFKAIETFNLATNNCASATISALLAAGGGAVLSTKPTTDTAVAAEYANNLSDLVTAKVRAANHEPKYGATIEDFNTKQKATYGSEVDKEKRQQITLTTVEEVKAKPAAEISKTEVHRQKFGFKFAQEAHPGVQTISDEEKREDLNKKYAFLLAIRQQCYRDFPGGKKAPSNIKEIMNMLKVGVGQNEKEINAMFDKVKENLIKMKDKNSGFYQKFKGMLETMFPLSPTSDRSLQRMK